MIVFVDEAPRLPPPLLLVDFDDADRVGLRLGTGLGLGFEQHYSRGVPTMATAIHNHDDVVWQLARIFWSSVLVIAVSPHLPQLISLIENLIAFIEYTPRRGRAEVQREVNFIDGHGDERGFEKYCTGNTLKK